MTLLSRKEGRADRDMRPRLTRRSPTACPPALSQAMAPSHEPNPIRVFPQHSRNPTSSSCPHPQDAFRPALI